MAGKKYFLCKVDGCPGESPDPKYPEFFEIDNWGWDAYMQATQQTGAGMVMGKVTLGTFSFDKLVDKATPKLRDKCAKGEHIQTVKCIARIQGKKSGELEEFAWYTFTNCVITGSSISGLGSGGGLPSERIEISFETLRFEYDQSLVTGTTAGKVAGEFNSKTNQVA